MSTKTAKSAGCDKCPMMEQKYKDNPQSFWMRIWHWHSGWCPGHKAYRKAEAEKRANNS
jgi:hypothetical protein